MSKILNKKYDICMNQTKFAESMGGSGELARLEVTFTYPEEILLHHTESEVMEFVDWYIWSRWNNGSRK